MKTRAWIIATAAFAIGAGAVLVSLRRDALAQRIDARRPLTLTVGQGSGPATTIRGDAHRDGLVHAAFPRAPLRIEWKFPTGGGQIEQPPIVTNDAIIVVTSHGDVVWIPPDASSGHNELARQPIGIAAAVTSPPTLLSDGTIVVVGGSVDAVAVGVDKNGVRFRTTLSGALGASTMGALDAVAPLALDDGGIAIATVSEIAVLDAQGNIRARASLPEPLVGPLLASGGATPSARRIFAVSKSGVVYAWSAGSRDVTRVGSFQGTVEGGAVMTSDDTLLAVVGDARLMTLDVRQGLAVPLSTFAGGGYLGPVAFRRGVAYAMAGVGVRTFAVGVDSSGQEVLRVPVALSTATSADGGPIAFTVPPHVPVAVDETGTVAFAAPDGPIGVVDPAGIVTSIDGVCLRSSRATRGTTSLVSAGPGAFIVTCSNGSVVRIGHGQGNDAP